MRSDKGPWNDPNILKVLLDELLYLCHLFFFLKLCFVWLTCNDFCLQMVLSGEAQCFRQIVTVSNSEGRIIASDKPRIPMVRIIRPSYYVYNGSVCLF